MAKLTQLRIKSILASETTGLFADGNGLFLYARRGSTGNFITNWVFRYNLDGTGYRKRSMGLGGLRDVSLTEARRKAAECRRLHKEGTDPLDHRRQQRAERQAERQRQATKGITFSQLADEFIERRKTIWRGVKEAQRWRGSLEKYAFPVIGKLHPSKITTQHVLDILQPIWSTKAETARGVQNRLELILGDAGVRGLLTTDNPARWRSHLSAVLPPQTGSQKHHAALPYKEVADFLQQLPAIGTDTVTDAMRLCILTACRTSEVLNATWDELDLSARVWTIPAARMKGGKEHRLPLSNGALELLEALPAIEGNLHIFPGSRAGMPLSNMAMMMRLRRMGRSDLTMHGFRSTFRDWAAECTNVPREVCELSLAHSVRVGAEAAYWRGDLLDKRRELMEQWGDYCTTVDANGLPNA